MRAKEIIAALSLEELDALAGAIGSGSDADELCRTMQGPGAYEIAASACASAVMSEDLMLLCANPFDRVSADELADVAAFEAIGLVVSVAEDEYSVNSDMALAALPYCSVEFGFAATLIARLDEEERSVVAKAMEVGPRPSAIDSILDTAEELVTEATVMKHVAFLKSDERRVLLQALELGELPDDLEGFPLGSSPPLVTLDQGPAGLRGLVYWVTHEASGVETRPVVPLEVAAFLPRILDQVPPPPEVVATKSRRRRPASTPRRASPKKDDRTLSESVSGVAVTAPELVQSTGRPRDPFARSDRSRLTRTPFPSRAGDSSANPLSSSGALGSSDVSSGSGSISAFTSSGSNSPYRLGKVTEICEASAIVDLEAAKVVDAAMRDEELASAVLEVVAESLIVLRPGVDAQQWAESCARRLGL